MLQSTEQQLAAARSSEQQLRHQAAAQLRAVAAAYLQEIACIQQQLQATPMQRQLQPQSPAQQRASSPASTNAMCGRQGALDAVLQPPAQQLEPQGSDGAPAALELLLSRLTTVQQENSVLRQQLHRLLSLHHQRQPAAAAKAPHHVQQQQSTSHGSVKGEGTPEGMVELKRRQDRLEVRCSELAAANRRLVRELTAAQQAAAAAVVQRARQQARPRKSSGAIAPSQQQLAVLAAHAVLPGPSAEQQRQHSHAGGMQFADNPLFSRSSLAADEQHCAGAPMSAAAVRAALDLRPRRQVTGASSSTPPAAPAADASTRGAAVDPWAAVPASVLEWASQYHGDEGLARPCSAVPSSLRAREEGPVPQQALDLASSYQGERKP